MAGATDGKQHVSLVICGHVDAGKSTTTGRLIFELGGITERDVAKLRSEAEAQGKASFFLAFLMDKQKEERERGVTIACTTKEFYTATKHYTVIDAPGHRDFIKNMITGASQADVGLLMVPADGNFTAAIARGNHKAGIVQGQTRQHALLINLLGVKQLIVGVNKMDCDVAKYGEERFTEIKNEMVNMLVRVGWKKDMVAKEIPVLPLSGYHGDNLIAKSDKMPWWTGVDVVVNSTKETVHVDTLLDALERMVAVPARDAELKMRTPISGICKINGAGDVLTGRVEQGTVKPDDKVVFLPTGATGKVFSIQMHHKPAEQAGPGDNVGLNIKGLAKDAMPRVGDVMVHQGDNSVGAVASFTAQVQVLNHPGELKVGYCPIAFVRTARSAVKLTEIAWKIGKETGGQKAEDPVNLKAGDMAQCTFEPQQPFVVDTFKNCEGLGRIAIMEGASVVMLGKVVAVTVKEKK